MPYDYEPDKWFGPKPYDGIPYFIGVAQEGGEVYGVFQNYKREQSMSSEEDIHDEMWCWQNPENTSDNPDHNAIRNSIIEVMHYALACVQREKIIQGVVLKRPLKKHPDVELNLPELKPVP